MGSTQAVAPQAINALMIARIAKIVTAKGLSAVFIKP